MDRHVSLERGWGRGAAEMSLGEYLSKEELGRIEEGVLGVAGATPAKHEYLDNRGRKK